MPYPGYEPQREVSKAVFRGLAQGKAEGKLEGIRGSLRFPVGPWLGSDHGTVGTDQNACDDVERLNDWVRRAASVASTDELLGRAGPSK